MDFRWIFNGFSMDSQRSCYCFLEVFGSAWGAPVPKRAQRASEASARSDSARAVVKSRLVSSLSSRRLFVSSCFVSSRRVVSPRLVSSRRVLWLLLILTRFPFFADSGLFFTVFLVHFFVVFLVWFLLTFWEVLEPFWESFSINFRHIV